MKRDSIPENVKRAVLVEAGHRCAIPTCRATTTEIAHITPWSVSHSNKFENLIALCPNCHTRFDQKKDIDILSIKQYKQNLGLLNNRYGEFERRLFEFLAKTGDRIFLLGVAGDIMVANAIKDGFFEDMNMDGMSFGVATDDGFGKNFPMTFTFWVTNAGVDFIRRYAQGQALDVDNPN